MSTTQWLTVLGFIAGISEYAVSQQIYPQYAGIISAASLWLIGILAKGIEKK
jgi:hypothetical protein